MLGGLSKNRTLSHPCLHRRLPPGRTTQISVFENGTDNELLTCVRRFRFFASSMLESPIKNPVSRLKGFFLILTRMFPGRNIRFLIMPEGKILFGRRQETFNPKSDSSTQFSIASEMTEDEVIHVYPWVFEPIQAPKQRTCHTEDFIIVSMQTSIKRGSRRIGENGGSDILTRMETFAFVSIRSLS